MNKTEPTSGAHSESQEMSWFSRLLRKLKTKTYTCPFCRESFVGISAFSAHLKDHCT